MPRMFGLGPERDTFEQLAHKVRLISGSARVDSSTTRSLNSIFYHSFLSVSDSLTSR